MPRVGGRGEHGKGGGGKQTGFWCVQSSLCSLYGGQWKGELKDQTWAPVLSILPPLNLRSSSYQYTNLSLTKSVLPCAVSAPSRWAHGRSFWPPPFLVNRLLSHTRKVNQPRSLVSPVTPETKVFTRRSAHYQKSKPILLPWWTQASADLTYLLPHPCKKKPFMI